MSTLYITLWGFFLLLSVRLLRQRLRRGVIDQLPGPPPTTWLTGNLPDIYRSREMTEAHIAWTKEYGTTLRMHAEFSRKEIYTPDPKAIHHILDTSGYNYPKSSAQRAETSLVLGKGLVWADGPQHAQQRKIVTPAFSFNTLRNFIPLFRHKAFQTVNQIKRQIEGSESKVVNVLPWLSRTTLDIIGLAAAEYDFQAIEGGQNNRLANVYNNLLAEAFYRRSDMDLTIAYLLGNVPTFIFNLLKHLPTRSLKKMRNYMPVVTAVAQDVVAKQTELYAHGKEGSKDLMSVLVRANLSENPKTKLSDEEVISQLTTFFFAGHETTSSTLVWALYELSRHPECQVKVREEIKATRARVAEKGDSEITISDLDAMQYLLAVIKETLRLYPIVDLVIRQAGQDDRIPLFNPIKLTTGELITSLPVQRGQSIVVSFIAYNRLKAVWGEDAEVWRPERILEKDDHRHETGVGVISNIATFSSGVRGCIGWRFSMLEMQVILIELLENFEFLPPPGDVEILRVSAGVMSPMVEGSKSGKTELPLTIIPLQA